MRENLILTRMDDNEKDTLMKLARYYNISKSDVIRMLVTREYRHLDEAWKEYDDMVREMNRDAAER